MKKYIFLLVGILLLSFVSASPIEHLEFQDVNFNYWTGNLTNVSEMQDVNTTGVTDGQAFVWDAGNRYWNPQTIIGIIDTDTNASTACSGTTTYLDGEGNCDDISLVYTTLSEIFGFSYYNSTSFSIVDYLTSATIYGFGYYNSSDFSIGDYALDSKVDSLGNWSEDKGDYYTSAETDTEIGNANTSMETYVDAQDVIYNDSASAYTDSKLQTIYYNTTSLQVVTGTGQGVLGNIISYNGGSYNVSEVNSDFELRINFTGVSTINQLIYRYKTDSDEDHQMFTQVWDYDKGDWENYAIEGQHEEYGMFVYSIFDPDSHISGGLVQVRFYTINGVPQETHKWQFDWVAVAEGPATPSSSESDPFSIYRDGTVHLDANWDQGAFNFTNTDSWWLGKIAWAIIQDTPAYLLIADLVSQVGNWSDDKGDYYTSTETDTEITNANTSMKGYVDSNPGGYSTTTGTLTSVDTDDTYLTGGEITTTGTITFNTTLASISLAVDSADKWDGLDSPSAIGSDDITDDGTWRLNSWDNFTGIPHATPSNGDVTHFSLADEIYDWVIGLSYATTSYVDGLIASIGNWSADKGDYSTTTEAGILYEVQLDDEAGLYGVLSDVTQFYEAGDDVEVNNVTSIDCLVFDSGGSICSGS